MPPALRRDEFLLRNGRLEAETVRRRTKRSHWPHGIRDELVVAIEDTGGQRKITPGPEANPSLIARAYNRYRHLDCDPQAQDIGREVPEPLLQEVSHACKAAVRKLVRQYEAVATEEGATGLFSGEMNGATFSHGEWEATIYVQSFSPETKEPDVGADFGAVVDIRHANQRVVKGIIAQAKRVDEIPDDVRRLPDLAGQIRDMQARTDEAYILVYGSEDVEFCHSHHPIERLPVPSVMGEMMSCRRGDRRPRIIAEALDRDLVLEIAIAGPGAQWPTSPGPLN